MSENANLSRWPGCSTGHHPTFSEPRHHCARDWARDSNRPS
jgi:hypothetical protein